MLRWWSLDKETPEYRAYCESCGVPTDQVEPWNKGCYDDGAEARIMGYGKDQCPNEESIGRFARESWLAGWDDLDAELRKIKGNQ